MSVFASSGASIEKLLDHVNKELDWVDWYIHGHDIQPIASPADACFSCLREICQGQTTNKKPSILLLLSSFLNANNIHPDEGLMASISGLDRNAMILIVYGHATDETTKEQGKEISRYKAKMIEIDGSLKNRLVIVASKARTHEKCVLSSNGDWVIGSWNPCSSRPGSKQLEVVLHGHDGGFCGQILTHIEPLIEDRDAITIINQLRTKIKVDLSKDSEKEAKSFYQNLDKATKNLDGFLRSIDEFKGDVQAEYENVLSSARLCLVPFLKRARLEIINERISRDILINQIKVSDEDIFIASDRVSSSGLDRSILMDMSNPSRVGKKNVRILWGREWEEETQLDKADKEQLTEARKTIRLAQNILGPALFTATNPMENHAKCALFDGCRAIITSENLLSYGGEKTKYESRELGVFLYSIPVTRYIEGKAIFHRLHHFHPDADASTITMLPLEWIVDGINHFYAFKEFEQNLEYDFKKIQYIEAAILSALDDIENDADAFDIKQSSLKKAIYERRAKNKKIPLIEHLWLEGMRSYLLMPNTNKDWIPIFEPIESELEQLEFGYLNAANLDVPKGGLQSESPASKGEDIVASIMAHMVLVKNGSFIMGDDRVPDESPAHRVTISKDFL
nr:hypothetical protein [Candidatus Sigynarchaeota archaeon]